MWKLLLVFPIFFLISCSGGGDGTTVYEGYLFSKEDVIYITYDTDNNLYYRVVDGKDVGKNSSVKLNKVKKNTKIYEYKTKSVIYRAVIFSRDYRKFDNNHLIVLFIKDENFPAGLYSIGMLEKQKERTVPIRITWADRSYSTISITDVSERSTYRSFYIRNFAKEWKSESAEKVSKLLEDIIQGNLQHITNNPYTFEYYFIGNLEYETQKSIDLLTDGEVVIIRYTGSLENGIEIGIGNKNITIDDFEEGRRLWILCSDGSWAQGEIDDFHPTPDEADTIDKPKIDFVFNNGEKTKLYVTFQNSLCGINVEGSYACDFLTPYILDPKAQIIVLSNYKTDTEDNPVDCIGGW